MDYEKEYKKLKADIKKAYLFAQTNSTKAVLENILPELRESEDERIRKEMEQLIQCMHDADTRKERWIAWLEKQRESQNEVRYWTDEEIEPIISDYLRGAEHYGGMIARLRCLKPKSLEKQGELIPYTGVSFKYNGHTWGMCARDGGVEILVDGEIKERVFLFDRPQGKSALEAAKEEKVDNQNCVKLADNYRPKFHEGDWICGYYTNYRVTAINSKGYVVEDTDGNKINILFENEKFHHLWSVQDAKAGDILTWDDSKCIALFKNIYNKDSFNSYGFVGHCTGIFESWGRSYHDIEGAHPANKEQSDNLMKAMTDAGWEFDFEKNELKKLGQQCEVPVTINIDKMVMDYTNECGNDGFGKPLNCMIRAYRQGLTDAICTLTLANKKTTDKVEQEPTKWTEEDECYMSECICAIATKDGWSSEEKRKTKHWLKSLKQRIGG